MSWYNEYMSEETKYSGKYLTITEEQIGSHIYERVILKEGVRVYPIQEGKLLLIKEFRTHEGKARWKIVSGWIDKEGKSTLEIAQEELAEETGLQAEHWDEFYVYDTMGATVSTRIPCYIATGISELPEKIENPDNDEILEMRWVNLDELYGLIDAQEMFWDDETIACIQALRLHAK